MKKKMKGEVDFTLNKFQKKLYTHLLDNNTNFLLSLNIINFLVLNLRLFFNYS